MEAKPKYEDVKKSLRELQSRFDDGLINEFEYRGKSRQLLAQLEPSLPLGYYALLPGSATTGSVIGYLVLSVWKSSGGFFGLMTLTSGEWEVEDYDGDSTTLLPVISSGSGPQRWSFDGGQFRFDLEEDASYSGTVSLRVLPNSGNLAVTWELESCDYEYDWSHRGEATAIPNGSKPFFDDQRQAFRMISDARSMLTGTATREHFDKGPCT